MARADNEALDFITVMGEVFSEILSTEAGITNAAGHDFYSAIVDGTQRQVSFDEFQAWGDNEYARAAAALNKYFEIEHVKASHLAHAVKATLTRWAG